MQNFSFQDINKVVYINQIVDKEYLQKVILDNFVIRKDNLIEKLKNINLSKSAKLKKFILTLLRILSLILKKTYQAMQMQWPFTLLGKKIT